MQYSFGLLMCAWIEEVHADSLLIKNVICSLGSGRDGELYGLNAWTEDQELVLKADIREVSNMLASMQKNPQRRSRTHYLKLRSVPLPSFLLQLVRCKTQTQIGHCKIGMDVIYVHTREKDIGYVYLSLKQTQD